MNISGLPGIPVQSYIPVFIGPEDIKKRFRKDLNAISNEGGNKEIFKLSPLFIKEFYLFALIEKWKNAQEYTDIQLTELKTLLGWTPEELEREGRQKLMLEKSRLAEENARRSEESRLRAEEDTKRAKEDACENSLSKSDRNRLVEVLIQLLLDEIFVVFSFGFSSISKIPSLLSKLITP